jgi:hypothetical protein
MIVEEVGVEVEVEVEVEMRVEAGGVVSGVTAIIILSTSSRLTPRF